MTFWDQNNFSSRSTFKEFISAVRAIAPCEGLFMPSVLRKIQQNYFGLPAISRQTVLELERTSVPLTEFLQHAASKFAKEIPALCPLIRELVCSMELTDKELVLAVLRDKTVPFHVLAKESTGNLKAYLEECGVCADDSRAVSLGVYTAHRRTTKRALKGLSKLNNAKEALEHGDAHVDLGNCEISSALLEQTVPLICNNAQLVSLNLSGNNIHFGGARFVAQIVSSSRILTSLDVSGNNLLSGGLRLLFIAVKESKSLKKLNAANCHGGPGTADLANEFLCGHPSLESMNLSNNDMSRLECFPEIVNLSELSVSGNFLGFSSTSGIAKFLQDHPLLRKLDLSFNELDFSCWKALQDSLTAHPSLQVLLVTGNCWDDDAVKTIEEIVRKNVRIISTDLQQITGLCKLNKQRAAERISTLKASSDSQLWTSDDVEMLLLNFTRSPSTLRQLRGFDGPTLSRKRFEIDVDAQDWDRLLVFPW